MSVIQFVANYDDLSTDRGYQFKFHCDKCGNGYLSSFQPSVVGTAGSLLRAAGDLFGGWASSAGNSAYEIQRAVGGKGHDSALSNAVQEGKTYFHQCTRCGKWVCPQVCWNEKANLCEGCAPRFEEEIAASQAQAKVEAARQQLFAKAASTDYASGVDMNVGSVVRAPDNPAPDPPKTKRFCSNCGVAVGEARFCPECGTPVKAVKPTCSKCGFQPPEPVKFCPECGNRI
jgi:hypothetical protein